MWDSYYDSFSSIPLSHPPSIYPYTKDLIRSLKSGLAAIVVVGTHVRICGGGSHLRRQKLRSRRWDLLALEKAKGLWLGCRVRDWIWWWFSRLFVCLFVEWAARIGLECCSAAVVVVHWLLRRRSHCTTAASESTLVRGDREEPRHMRDELNSIEDL